MTESHSVRSSLSHDEIEVLPSGPFTLIRIGSAGDYNSCFYFSLLRSILPEFSNPEALQTLVEAGKTHIDRQRTITLAFRRDLAEWCLQPVINPETNAEYTEAEAIFHLNQKPENLKTILQGETRSPVHLTLTTLRDVPSFCSVNRTYSDPSPEVKSSDITIQVPHYIALTENLLDPQTREETFHRLADDFLFPQRMEEAERYLQTIYQQNGRAMNLELALNEAAHLLHLDVEELKEFPIGTYPDVAYSRVPNFLINHDSLLSWPSDDLDLGIDTLEINPVYPGSKSISLSEALDRITHLKDRIYDVSGHTLRSQNGDLTPEDRHTAEQCAGGYLYRIDVELAKPSNDGLPSVQSLLNATNFFIRDTQTPNSKRTHLHKLKDEETEDGKQKRIYHNRSLLWLRHLGNLLRQYAIEKRMLIMFLWSCSIPISSGKPYIQYGFHSANDLESPEQKIEMCLSSDGIPHFLTSDEISRLRTADLRTVRTSDRLYRSFVNNPDDLGLPLAVNLFMLGDGYFIRSYPGLISTEKKESVLTFVKNIDYEASHDTGDSIISIVSYVLGITIYVCQVCSTYINVYNIYTNPQASRNICLNYTGGHFETLGLIENGVVQTMFEDSHPAIQALKTQRRLPIDKKIPKSRSEIPSRESLKDYIDCSLCLLDEDEWKSSDLVFLIAEQAEFFKEGELGRTARYVERKAKEGDLSFFTSELVQQVITERSLV